MRSWAGATSDEEPANGAASVCGSMAFLTDFPTVDPIPRKGHPHSVSTEEIIDELLKLRPDELRLVRERLGELEAGVRPEPSPQDDPFLEAAGKVGKARPHWPLDYALNHGHYVSGEPRKS